MNSTLPLVHLAPPHSFFSCQLLWLLQILFHIISTDLSSLCPVPPNSSSYVSHLKSSFVSSHHFTLTFHNSLNPFHPHPHCVVSSSLQLGLKSLFRLDITSNELKGGNSTVVALYWECPAAGVKTVTIVSYRRSKTSQLWFNLLIVVLPAGVKTVTIVSDPIASETAVVQLPHLLIVASLPPLLV